MIWLFVRHVNRFVFGHIDQLQEFQIGRTERLVRVTLSICHNFVINYSTCAAAIRRFSARAPPQLVVGIVIIKEKVLVNKSIFSL